jgi:hypothetical protein
VLHQPTLYLKLNHAFPFSRNSSRQLCTREAVQTDALLCGFYGQ